MDHPKSSLQDVNSKSSGNQKNFDSNSVPEDPDSQSLFSHLSLHDEKDKMKNESSENTINEQNSPFSSNINKKSYTLESMRK